ncbi:MAG: exo-beta-N-acetylmuramidase NamZ domain-containing protein [Planctomycetota bacterium]
MMNAVRATKLWRSALTAAIAIAVAATASLGPRLLAQTPAAADGSARTDAPNRSKVATGIDVLAADGCRQLQGRKVGLITNHTGRTADGRRTVDVLAAAENVQLTALFSPEHGWQGVVDEKVGDTVDAATGLKVFSLYGKTRTPTDAMLANVDTLVFDIQDIGCRFYTYIATMRNALEAAAQHGLRFVVLDRPNPIGGLAVAGPVLAADNRDFVAAHTVPLRHGMTIGELARMIVGENGLAVDLDIVRCRGWQRADLWHDTGLPWIDPSPNMRRLSQALTYPGIGLVEGTNVSVGRGTDTPFEILGAPWIDARALAAELTEQQLPGIAFVPVHFTPTASKHRGERCGGVHILLTDWRTFEPVRTGIHVACALHKLFAASWQTDRLNWLLKDQSSCDAILNGDPADKILARWQQGLRLFGMRRRPFLLYE